MRKSASVAQRSISTPRAAGSERRRTISAAMANAANRPATVSPSGKFMCSGVPSTSPVSCVRPLMASKMRAKPPRCRYGPVWPKPVRRSTMRRGLTACSVSKSSPHSSSLPARKFSTSTSACAASRSSSARPSALRTSSVMPRLPRFVTFQYSERSPLTGWSLRSASLPSGSSIFVTSAPRSAHSAAPNGPATTVERSRMRTPCSGPCSGSWFCGEPCGAAVPEAVSVSIVSPHAGWNSSVRHHRRERGPRSTGIPQSETLC